MDIPNSGSVTIENFCFDYNNEKIILNNSSTLEFQFFDLNGNLERTVSNAALNFNNFDYFDGGFIFLMNYKYGEDEVSPPTHKILLTDTDLKLKKKFIPFDTDIISKHDMYDLSNTFFRLNGNDTLYLTIPGDYTVYQFSNGGLSNEFGIYPSKDKRLPLNFLNSPDYMGKRIEYINSHNNKVFALQDVFISPLFQSFRLESRKNLMDTRILFKGDYINLSNVSHPFNLCYSLPIINCFMDGIDVFKCAETVDELIADLRNLINDVAKLCDAGKKTGGGKFEFIKRASRISPGYMLTEMKNGMHLNLKLASINSLSVANPSVISEMYKNFNHAVDMSVPFGTGVKREQKIYFKNLITRTEELGAKLKGVPL